MIARAWRSPFAPVVVAVVALVASLVRWSVQGSGNRYTALAKRFYIPDRDLGWRISVQHPIWLGLEVCAVIAAIAVALTIVAVVTRRRRARALRIASWIVAVVPLAVPIAAFASGPGPVGGRDDIPHATVATFTGMSGGLAVPAGIYAVVAHEGTAVTARVSAGGEAFDARFTGVTGELRGDLHDLTATASFHVATASVDTGIGERSKHAREGYLKAVTYPTIELAIDRVIAARPAAAGIELRAAGTLALIGKHHAIDIVATLQQPDAAALARLGLAGDIVLVQADFTLRIRETALAADAGDFDGDDLPIHASLVLRRSGDARE